MIIVYLNCENVSKSVSSLPLLIWHDYTVGIWILTSWMPKQLNTKLLKFRSQMVPYSNVHSMCLVLCTRLTFQIPDQYTKRTRWCSYTDIAMVPTKSKYGHFCLDLKWLLTKWQPCVLISNDRISNLNQNPDHVQTDLFSTLKNPDPSRLQIPTEK